MNDNSNQEPVQQPTISIMDFDDEATGPGVGSSVNHDAVRTSVPHSVGERDRIVILGRRRSGKTIYLARVYERLWNSNSARLHMRAIDGNSHLSLMRIVGALGEGEWPAATGGNTYSSFELTFDDEKISLVMLDYPGEVFRRAFVDGIVASDTKELVEHVDRALAIVCLIDPGNILDGNLEEIADDEFGMVQALDRVRRSHGGADIPIAMVITKCDVHGKRIKDLGGLRKFVEGRMLNVLRIAGCLKYFGSSAVRSIKDADGNDIPDISKPAVNIVKPLTWAIKEITDNRKKKEVAQARFAHDQMQREHLEKEIATEMESIRKTRQIWIISIVIGSFVAMCCFLWAISKLP